MNRTFALGDLHGNYKALMQCLQRSEFDYENDLLIQLGDVADGYSDVFECVEELLKIKNRICIKGNHDDWLLDFIEYGQQGAAWKQGGLGTLKSYLRQIGEEDQIHQRYIDSGYNFYNKSPIKETDIPESHKNFFRTQVLHHTIGDKFFVHGGFNRHYKIEEHEDPYVFYWDRDLFMSALAYQSMLRGEKKISPFKNANGFKEIFIGHTTTLQWGKTQPMKAANIWNLDTGAGFKGKLTIMDINTQQYWQSDSAEILYPNENSR